MASTDALPIPRKNVAFRVTFPILDNDGDLVTGAAGLDSEISKDGGTFSDCTNEATEIATSSGMYYLDLTSTEMNADTVAIIVKTSTTDAKTTTIVLYPAEDAELRASVRDFGGTAGTFASGRPEVKLGDVAHAGTAATLTLERIIVASTTSNEPGVKITGNGTGAAILATGGANGNGATFSAGATSGIGLNITSPTNGDGLYVYSANGYAIQGYSEGTSLAGMLLANVSGGVSLAVPNGFTADSFNASALATDAVQEIRDSVVAIFTDDVGTAQAGGSNTITLRSGAVATDDYYNGAYVTLTGGTGVGQTRKITDYVGSTKVATLDSNWVTNPDNTSTYIILGRAV